MAVVLLKSQNRGVAVGLTPVLPAGTDLRRVARDDEAAAELATAGLRDVEDVRGLEGGKRPAVGERTLRLLGTLRTVADLVTDLPEDLLACRFARLLNPPGCLASLFSRLGIETLRDVAICAHDERLTAEGEAGIAARHWALHHLMLLPACAVPDRVNLFARPLAEPLVISGTDPLLHIDIRELALGDKSAATLLRKGVVTVRDLLPLGIPAQFYKNPKAVPMIRERLADVGLTWEAQVEGDVPTEACVPVPDETTEYFRRVVRRFGYRSLLDHALEILRPVDRDLLRFHYVEGLAPVDAGRPLGIGVNNVSSAIAKALTRTRPSVRLVLAALARKLLPEIERLGGVVHAQKLADLTGEPELRDTWLATAIGAGRHAAEAWLGEFLCTLDVRKRTEVLARLGDLLMPCDHSTLSPQQVGEGLERDTGVRLDRKSLMRLTQLGLGLAWTGSGWKPTTPYSLESVTDEITHILREEGRPMTSAELLDAYAANRYSRWSVAKVRKGEGGSAEPVGRRPLPASTSIAVLMRHRPEVFRIDERTYVHQRGLPLPVARLKQSTDWCVRRLAEAGGAHSVPWLLTEMDGAGLKQRNLTPHLLAWVLAGHQDLTTLCQGRFEHRVPSEAKPAAMSLRQRLKSLSMTERRFLPAEEFRARLDGSLSYSHHAVLNALRHDPEFLLLAPYRFLHARVVRGDEDSLQKLTRFAFDLLPLDGSPIPTSRLVAPVEAACGPILPGSTEQAEILLGLLAPDDRVLWGWDLLVARKVRPGHRNLLMEAMLDVVREHGAADVHEILSGLATRFDYHGPIGNVSGRASVLVSEGRLVHLPGGLYVDATTRSPTPMEVIRKHGHRMGSLVRRTEGQLGRCGVRALWMAASYFWETGDLKEVRTALDVMLALPDVPPELRQQAEAVLDEIRAGTGPGGPGRQPLLMEEMAPPVPQVTPAPRPPRVRKVLGRHPR